MSELQDIERGAAAAKAEYDHVNKTLVERRAELKQVDRELTEMREQHAKVSWELGAASAKLEEIRKRLAA